MYRRKSKTTVRKSPKIVKNTRSLNGLIFLLIISALGLAMAAPIVSWQSAVSTSCPTQGPGSSVIEVDGFLYIVAGNSTTNFSRFNPATQTCTAMAATPESVSIASTMEKIDSDTILLILGNQSGRSHLYKISVNAWVNMDRAKLDSGLPIDQTGATQGVGNTIVEANDSSTTGTDFFVLAGNSTTFQRYTPSTNTWTTRAVLPATATNGAALAYPGSGDFIYAFAGNSTNSYRYSISGNSWTALGATPATVGPGAALTFVGTDLYAFGGNNTKNFWRYDSTQATPGSWTNLTSTNTPPSYVRGGGALTSVGTTIYALQGNNSRNFWKYNTATGVWNSGGTPAQAPEKVVAGGSLSSDGTNVFAFRGANTKTFWKYTVATDTWSVLENIPFAVGTVSSTTTAKGGLTYSSTLNELYAVTGNGFTGTASNSRGLLWRYPLSGASANTWPYHIGVPEGPNGNNMRYGISAIKPGVSAYDTTGDYVYVLGGGATQAFWKYSPFNSTWIPWDRSRIGSNTAISQVTSSAVTESAGNTIVEANGELYVAIGNSTTFMKYNPTTNKWSDLAAGPTITASSSMVAPNDNYIYVVDGSQTWKYDIANNSWLSASEIGKSDTGVVYSQDGSFQNAGSAITEVNGKIYVVPGSGSSFDEFDPTTNTWLSLTTTPTSTTSGTAMAPVGSNDIYVLDGGALNLYKFDILNNSWTSTLAAVPGATVLGAGASIVYPGSGDYLYVLKGNNTTEFYRYSISGNSWTTLAVTPGTVRMGGSMTMIGTDIYAFRGNNTADFYRYDTTQTPGSDSWTTLSGPPEVINTGGSLTTDTKNTPSSADDVIYAVRGNASSTFWKYTPGTATWRYEAFAPDTFGQVASTNSMGGIVYSPTLGDIFGITGDATPTQPDGRNAALMLRYKLTPGTNQYNWIHTQPIPAAPTSIARGTGSAYTGSGEVFYTTQGSGSTGFFSFDTSINTEARPEWNTFAKSTLDNGEPISQAGITQNYTASLIEVDNYFYIIPNVGSPNTFERFDPATNTWYKLAPLPFSTTGSARHNTMMQIPSQPDYIYALVSGSGFADGSFFRYSITDNAWTRLTDTPADVGGSSKLLYPGAGEWLYTPAGNSPAYTHDLWRYSITKELWVNFTRGKFDGYVNGNVNTNPTPISQDGGTQGTGNALVTIDSATHGKKIFSFPGGSTTFQEFNIETNTWTNRASAPTSAGFGAQLVWDGNDVIYATTTSPNFYAYCLPTAASCTFNGVAASPNTWTTLTSASTYGSGASLTIVPGDSEYLYLTRGRSQGTSSFHRYCRATIAGATCAGGQTRDTWQLMATLPFTTDGGSGLSGFDSNTIYLTGGGFSTNFAVYSISGNSWSNLTSTNPVPATVNAGGKLINDGTYLYTTRGNTTNSFYRYDPAAASGSRWSSLANAPVTIGESSSGSHNGGIGLIASNNEIWAMPGTASTGLNVSKGLLYRYKIATNEWPAYYAPTTSGLGLYRPTGATIKENEIYIIPGNFGTSFAKYTITPDRTAEFPTAGSWTTLPSTPVPSNGPSLDFVGNNLYAMRGHTRPDVMYFSPTIQNKARLVGGLNATTNLTQWNLTTAGYFDITIDGVARHVHNIDFSGVTSMAEVASRIQTALRAVTGSTETVQWCTDFNNGYFLFESATPAPGGSISALGASHGPDAVNTDISRIYGGGGTSSATLDGASGIVKNPSTVGDWAYCGSPATPSLPDAPVSLGDSSSGSDLADAYYSPTRNEIWVLNDSGVTGNTSSGQPLLLRFRVDTDTGTAGDQNSWPYQPALPSTPAAINGGGAIAAADSDTLYALRGGTGSAGTTGFFRYHIPSNTWTDLSSTAPTPAAVGPGGALVSDGTGRLFATRGSLTPTFWVFDTTTETWNPSGTPPAAPTNVGYSAFTTAGGGMTFYDNKIWLVPGFGSSTITDTSRGLLYLFDPISNTWPVIEDPTDNTSATGGFVGGSDLTSIGGNKLYALQGSTSTANRNFWEYDFATEAWTSKADLPSITPAGATADIQSGGSLESVYNDTAIYATRGKATKDFCKYTVANDTWTCDNPTQDFAVNVGTASTIEDRGELAFSTTENKLYGIPGSSTLVYQLDLDLHAAFGAINGGSNPLRAVPFDVVVQSTDASGDPFPVSQNTTIQLSVATGTGTLGGTITGTILSGQSQATISGVTYSVTESGVSLTATDISAVPTLIASNSSTFAVDEPGPSITSIVPDSGTVAGGTTVTISGNNFQTGATVTFDGLAATVSSTSLTEIIVITPAHPSGPGAVNVVVTNPDTQSDTAIGGYTYLGPGPTISDVDPALGSIAGGTAVTITGTNFEAGATVTFDGNPATNVTLVSSTSITADTPAGSGIVDVVVTNPDTQSATLVNGYTYVVGGGGSNAEQNIICDTAGFISISAVTPTVTFIPRTVDFYTESPAGLSPLLDGGLQISVTDTRGYDPTAADCGGPSTLSIQSSGLVNGTDTLNLQLGTALTAGALACTSSSCYPTTLGDVATVTGSTGSISSAIDIVEFAEAFSGTIRTSLQGDDLQVVPPSTAIPTGTYSGTITFTLS